MGGMEVGSGMLYPVSVVDGLVHHHGGWRLEIECRMKSMVATNGEACPVGEAVVTSAGNGRLSDTYEKVVHTTPPFFKYHDNPQQALLSCYSNALHLAFLEGARVAAPLIGAGARGFPYDDAIHIAATGSREWCAQSDASQKVLLFCLLKTKNAEKLAIKLEELK
jgi:O-acetyl-ADP-ribose deacetylase (regulator of RNase III)